MTDREVGQGLGVNPNSLRYAAPTGTVLIRWEGARASVVWTMPPPEVDPAEARLELARRYLHVFGPVTAEAFARWAGIGARQGFAAFAALESAMTRVGTPIGDAWILTEDEPTFRETVSPAGPARLLPSGDAYYLLHGADRELLVPEPERRAELWTSRVWPGAVLLEGEIVGTWRRAAGEVGISSWRALSAGEHDAIEAEASTLPLPALQGAIRVRWDAIASRRERRSVILSDVRDPRLITVRRGGTLLDDDHHRLAVWAADCAEHVLRYFEAVRSDDDRPRRAIELGRAWARGEVTMTEARTAAGHANAAARDLRGAARHAGFAAAQAAAVAHVAAHELGAAAYAIKAARAAASAGETETAGRLECLWQRDQLPDAIRDLVLDDQRLRNDICWFVFDC